MITLAMLFDFLIIVLFFSAIVAVASSMMAKSPNAQRMVNNVMPVQIAIGLAALGIALANLIRVAGTLVDSMNQYPSRWAVFLAGVACALLLGLFFAMPMIGKWIPGNSPAEQKMTEMVQKIAPMQMILGLAAAGVGLLLLLQRTGVYTVSG